MGNLGLLQLRQLSKVPHPGLLAWSVVMQAAQQ